MVRHSVTRNVWHFAFSVLLRKYATGSLNLPFIACTMNTSASVAISDSGGSHWRKKTKTKTNVELHAILCVWVCVCVCVGVGVCVCVCCDIMNHEISFQNRKYIQILKNSEFSSSSSVYYHLIFARLQWLRFWCHGWNFISNQNISKCGLTSSGTVIPSSTCPINLWSAGDHS